ncbi:MAG: patatin-like phospholipase family protein [Pseudobdellovibrio sp.]
MPSGSEKKIGLVLSGGGARAGYHAGVLKGLNQVLEKSGLGQLKFDIICGTSSGAINGAFLASRCDDLPNAVEELWESWSQIATDDIIDANGVRIIENATKLVFQLGFGGLFNIRSAKQLLDTAPLLNYLTKKIDFNKIKKHIEAKKLFGLSITATHYGTGSAVVFFDGSPVIEPWTRSYYIAKRTLLDINHVLASSSIPLFFPAIKIDQAYYGDGAIRMKSPLSPAIHLGADKVFAIGNHEMRTPVEALEINNNLRMSSVQLSDISGVVMDSLFLDGLDADLERMERVNRYINTLSLHNQIDTNPEKLRNIPVLAIQPSQNLGKLALKSLHQMPAILRHMMKGIGVSDRSGAELLSYLAFEKAYSQQLLTLGFEDAIRNKKILVDWFTS